MNGLLLSDYQAACRAAHEQVQLLGDLYEHLAEMAGTEADIRPDRRRGELRDFLALLESELERQDLLPKQPDPEREEALELLTGLEGRLTAENRQAVTRRLALEEERLLELGERLLASGEASGRRDSLETCISSTREAAGRLSRTDR